LRILELCTYSAGGCGVFARVKQEAQLLADRGNEVMIFSTYFEKGTNKIMPLEDKIGKVRIRRFPAKKIGGESFSQWHFEEEAIKFKPDVIIAHSYRQTHTTRALCLKEKRDCKVILVTHAPFGRDRRGFVGKMAVRLYDRFVGRKTLNNFDKIFAITYWEYMYLHELGVREDKIEYVPNGISEEYFSKIKGKKEKRIIYTGRISPIKNLEVVIRAMAKIEDKKVGFVIYGPAEKDYLNKLNRLISELRLENRVKIVLKTYNKKEQITELDKSSIFILPSFSEGMPQSLIEAMARECIVVGSNNKGNSDLIKEEENGFTFTNDDENDLTVVLNKVLAMDNKELDKIRKNTRKYVEQFKWDKIIDKILKIIKSI